MTLASSLQYSRIRILTFLNIDFTDSKSRELAISPHRFANPSLQQPQVGEAGCCVGPGAAAGARRLLIRSAAWDPGTAGIVSCSELCQQLEPSIEPRPSRVGCP